jgi:hypothetical protein
MKIAKGCNQLININTTSEELCSEDVWLSK